jgi:hypothetical protein
VRRANYFVIRLIIFLPPCCHWSLVVIGPCDSLDHITNSSALYTIYHPLLIILLH